MEILVFVALYIALYAFGLWGMCQNYLKKFGRVTVGDLTFFAILGVIVPVGVLIALKHILSKSGGVDWDRPVFQVRQP
jgi:uncharacterized membrane protein